MEAKLQKVIQLCYTYPERDPPKNAGYHRLTREQLLVIHDWDSRIVEDYFSPYFRWDHMNDNDEQSRDDNYEGFSIPVYYPALGFIFFTYNYYGLYHQYKSYGQVTDLKGNKACLSDIIQTDYSDGIGEFPDEERVLTKWLKPESLWKDYHLCLEEGHEKWCTVIPKILSYHERKLRMERIHKKIAARKNYPVVYSVTILQNGVCM